jgi:hypothetical protein
MRNKNPAIEPPTPRSIRPFVHPSTIYLSVPASSADDIALSTFPTHRANINAHTCTHVPPLSLTGPYPHPDPRLSAPHPSPNLHKIVSSRELMLHYC